MKNYILCTKCKVPYKILQVTNKPDNVHGKLVCPSCSHMMTIHAPIEIVRLFV